MFEHQERVALLLLFGVTIVVLLAYAVLGSMGNQPFSRPFSSSSVDGELVVYEGVIDQIAFTKSGGHMTLTMENLSIFIPAEVATGISLKKGDRIRVYGIVQTYHGKKEIVVSSADGIHLKENSL
jgi:DNA/RNA endonuclease YhcR with UshA esterase domain